MNKFTRVLSGQAVLQQMPEDDVIARQRFILYRIFSFTGALVCIGIFSQMMITIPEPGLLPFLILMQGIIMTTNFFMTKKAEKLQRHYRIMMVAAFCLVHCVAYTCGGIMTGGSLFWAVIILYAYMLLGKKSGQYFTIGVVAHFVYMFIISRFTNLTSFAMFKNDEGLISQDFLTNGILSAFLISVLAAYMQSGKNVVIQSITKSRDTLAKKNSELKNKNKLLNAYSHGLEKTNKELEKFVSIASHDLKSPLRAVAWLTAMIEEDMEGKLPADVQTNFNIIKQRVSRMEQLLNGLLEYTKSEKPESEITEVDLNDIVEDFIAIEHNGKTPSFMIQAGMPKVRMEELKLRRVLSNIIDNAIRFNDKDHVAIMISTEVNDAETIIHIEDNGPGIEEQYHEKIFVLFQTLSRRDEHESMGVGLSVAKKIVEQRNGKIWLRSTLGEGTRFSFSIPHVVKANLINEGRMVA